MTSSNPFIAVGWINPAHSLHSSLWRHKSSQFKESKGVWATTEELEGKRGTKIARGNTEGIGKKDRVSVTSGYSQSVKLNRKTVAIWI